MTEWTTVAVGVVTALAAILGSVGGQWLAGRNAERRELATFRRQRWEATRTACLDLLSEIEELDARAGGAVLTRDGMTTSIESTRSYLRARTAAELSVSARTWEEMQPLIEAVQLRVNVAARRSPSELRQDALERLREIGANEEEGWDALRRRYMDAVRLELSDPHRF